MTATGTGADLADRSEDNVFRSDPGRQLAVEPDPHCPRLGLTQRLCRQDMHDLGCADPECERAEPAVRTGVTVTAHNRHARLAQAQLRADDMHDALPFAAKIEIGDAGGLRTLLHLAQQPAAVQRRIGATCRVGGNSVVWHAERQFWIVNFEATIRDPPQARPTLKVMQKMAINCQQGHAAAQFRHHM